MSLKTDSSSPKPVMPMTPPTGRPGVKVTLPTPPSFAARRALSYTKESPPSPQPKADHHVRSVSFSLHQQCAEDERKVYRIPQRFKEDAPASLTAPPTLRSIPKPLNLAPRSTSTSSFPFDRMPTTAPHSRFANTAASRGLSIAPALARGARHSTSNASGVGGSIWSAGINPNTASGWISPALNSARSVGTAARQRGLTVAVLKDGKEMIVGDVPLTPGLASANPLKSDGLLSSPLFEPAAIPEEREQGTQGSPRLDVKAKPDVVILCRYYHTPGLTCTSRPCRFVHNLETLKSPKSVDQYEMKSPNADPTGGTFAQAQMKAQAKILNVDELVNNGAAPGETVVLSSGEGHKIVGTVYLMSGGGKGPAGKSRSKFKTVACKDFAEGSCQYGAYCSFIHEEKFAVQDNPAGRKDEDARHNSTGTALQRPSFNAWTKTLPHSIPASSVTVDETSLDKQKRRLSAFAAPYSTTPLRVDEKGDMVPHVGTTEPLGATTLFKPKTPPQKSSAWAKGPPLALKKVSIVEPTADPDATRTHLAPPVSAISLFGTESDPATPWDPAMRRKFEEEGPDPEYSDSVFTPPSPVPSPPVDSRPPAWQTPAYPWGMPMSPTSPLSDLDPMSNIPGGPGVMWTPAGWAVQDAAMKHSLRAAEIKAKNEYTKAKGKSYYKTRVCKYYLEGSCPHGENCTYVHDGPLGTQPPKPNKHRVLPCKFFNSAGGCSNGDQCDFLHTFVVPPSVPLVEKPRPWRTKPCRHYQLGRCHLGDACHFAHVPDPTHRSIEVEKICRHWTRGRCEKGASCKFRHEGIMEEQLTEARLAQTFEAMRTKTYREVCDDEDDDVEIVTQDTGTQVSFSPAQSVGL